MRAALLTLMRQVVHCFPRPVQHIFPALLPVWLAATGDVVPSVAQVAVRTLEDTLATPVQRDKVVARYADNRCAYCADLIDRLPPTNDPHLFLSNARCFTVVLIWLVSTARSLRVVAPVIDATPDPLMLLARGPRQKRTRPSDPHPAAALPEA